ncbi:hypothetical protein M885DRAFT_497585 [Pelagophyceae sp. CCMP2097]|nr:hypothetical protein M885DRAFT_497585 [Pelagophyceae sp. CCMP2097]
MKTLMALMESRDSPATPRPRTAHATPRDAAAHCAGANVPQPRARQQHDAAKEAFSRADADFQDAKRGLAEARQATLDANTSLDRARADLDAHRLNMRRTPASLVRRRF